MVMMLTPTHEEEWGWLQQLLVMVYYIVRAPLSILHVEFHLIFTIMEIEECVIIIQILQMRK